MAAKAYMAKVYLYQSKWKECLSACDEVIQSGKYTLYPDFREVFLPENDNNSEIIFAVQLSINDGASSNQNEVMAIVCYRREVLIQLMDSCGRPRIW